MRKRILYGLGIPLLLFNAWFGAYSYIVVQALLWTQTSLQRGPIVLLFLITLLNLLCLRFAKRLALRRAEMTTLYGMLTVGTCVQGVGFVQFLINQMAGVFYYSDESNGWREQLWPAIPRWFAPRDPQVLNGFFRGNSSLYHLPIVLAWATPIAAWSAFIFALFWTLLCLTTLMRRQWIERERLTFPLVQLPLYMTAPLTTRAGDVPFWQNPWMWSGFVLAGALESINFLNYLIPNVPALPIKPVGPNELDALLTIPPWNGAGMLRLAFYPFAIGIGYLMTLDVSFSCWFFYLCTKAGNIVCSAFGFSDSASATAARAPFWREQGTGAFLALAFYSLWSARDALKQAWQSVAAQTPENAAQDTEEIMPYRMAFFSGALATLFLVGFLWLAGLDVVLALVLVTIYLCFALALARIVSEAGAGWAWAPDWTPAQFTTDLVGSAALTKKSLIILHGYTSWMSDMRDNPMPQQMHDSRLTAAVSRSARPLLAPLSCAALVGILAAFWANLDIYYRFGAASAKVRPWLASFGTAPFNQTMAVIQMPTPADFTGFAAAGIGAMTVIGLTLLRQIAYRLPFHPLGFALATTRSMEYMWFPFFIAWLIKALVLRYGGIRQYRLFLPFFLGLILGDYIVPAVWGVFGMLTGTQQYMAFPH